MQSSSFCFAKKNLLPITVFMISEVGGYCTSAGRVHCRSTTFGTIEYVLSGARVWHEVQPLLDATLEVLNKIPESALTGDGEWQKLLAKYILDVKEKVDITVSTSAIGRSRTSYTSEEDRFLKEFCLPHLDILQSNLVGGFPKKLFLFFQLFDPAASLSIVELLQVAAKQLAKATTDSENML